MGPTTNLPAATEIGAPGRLAAESAHEIRNSLGAIRGAGEILQDDFPTDHPKAEFLVMLRLEIPRPHDLVGAVLSQVRGGDATHALRSAIPESL